MKLDFISLTIKDFRSFADEQTLELSRGASLWFVRGLNQVEPGIGSNGAGKSSIWAALCWCLYGKTSDGLRNPDLKPWSGKNAKPCVTLEIELDGQPHTIERTATTNGLVIDGQTVGSEEVAKLIRLPFDAFINTILLAQGQPLFFDRGPKDKMQLFADVLQLERWDARSEAASAKAKELENLEAEMIGETTGLEAALKQAEELLDKAKQNSEEWGQERKAQAAQLETTLKAKRTLLEGKQKELDTADLTLDRNDTELKVLTKQLPERNKAVLDAREEHNEAVFTLKGKQREAQRLEAELVGLGNSDTCPTCEQPIKGTQLGKHKKELETQLQPLNKSLALGIPKVLVEAVTKAETQLKTATLAAEEFEEKVDRARTTVNRLTPEVAALKSETLALTERRDEKREEANPYAEQIQNLRRKTQQTEVQLKGLREDLDKAARQIARTRFWVKGFRDVQLYIITEVLQELELATNSVLAEVGLQEWRVCYSVEKETKSGTLQRGLNVEIYSPSNKEPVRYESWSGGEAQRLRLVGALALSEVLLRYAGVETNLEVLDEPTRHLSSEGVRDLCSFLGSRTKSVGRTCYLIDHTAREGGDFEGVISVVKTKEGSRIE